MAEVRLAYRYWKRKKEKFLKFQIFLRYQNRKLPVVFIAVDPTEDETEKVLEVAKTLAKEFWGTLSFAHLDGKLFFF